MTREEAIKAIKAWDFLNNDEKEVIETLIPELAESEDERIRKEIISALKYANHKGVYDKHLAWLEKQGGEPFDYENANIQQKDFASKAEPKFKVKYAGNEYNVLEVKDIAGVTYYGIEDEPNHIDYVQAENCERVGGYGIKENGSPYPTKPAVFSEQKPAWSEEDEEMYLSIMSVLLSTIGTDKAGFTVTREMDWLKSIKDRCTWKPSDEQMENLSRAFNGATYQVSLLRDLYLDLKKLKG